jgi:UDP-glucose 4-epimerase
VITHAEDVIKQKVKHRYGPRREGDPAVLIADGRRFKEAFDWTPTHSRLDTIIGTAWAWYNSRLYTEGKA